MRHVLAGCLMAVLAAAPAAAADHRALALAAAEAQAGPGYELFRQRSATLHHAATAFCGGSGGRAAVEAGFHGTMDAWQEVQHVTFGPVEALNRGQRVHFWPDKKNAGDRQMLQILKEGSIPQPDRIAFASVAVQGLPALEFLLFAEGQGEQLAAGGDRCRFVTTITANLAQIGQELATEWPGFRAAIATAGGPDSPFSDARQAAAQIFNAVHAQLEAVAEVKLARPLGSSADEARVQRAESWRSQRSLRNVALNLRGLKGVAEAAFLPRAPEPGRRLIAALDDAIAAAEASGPVLVLDTPEDWRRVATLKAKVKAVARIIESELGPALGLQLGFNSLDGD